MRKKKDKTYRIYGDLLHEHKPTIASLVFNYFYHKMLVNERTKTSIYREDAKFIPEVIDIDSSKTKFLTVLDKDNVVIEILRISSIAADKLLDKQNTIVSFSPEESFVKIGSVYKDGIFENKEDNNEEDTV